MFTMYDSVDLSQVPASPHAVACYIDGKYANEQEARRRFPHARILTISAVTEVPADCYDVENGDHRPETVPALVRLALDHGVWMPCVYADLSTMPLVKLHLAESGIDRRHVRLWVAYYNGAPDLPTGYDAHQFTDRALGRNLDESICADTFFRPSKPTPVERLPRAIVAFDPDEEHWTIDGIPAGSEAETPGK